jgi:hypothetical protein
MVYGEALREMVLVLIKKDGDLPWPHAAISTKRGTSAARGSNISMKI